MKREFLTELFKKHLPDAEIPKEVIDGIMDENGKDAESGKVTLTKAQSDLKAAQTQVTELGEQIKKRDADIAELQKQAATSDDTKKALTELQAKYDTESKEFQTKLEEQQKEAEKQLAEQAYSHATEVFFKDQPFASELARKAAIADFKTAGLKLDENGKFLGADDWLKQLRETDPAAFKPEQSEEDDEGAEANKPPHFVAPTAGNGGVSGSGAKAGAFDFTNAFTMLRQPQQQQTK